MANLCNFSKNELKNVWQLVPNSDNFLAANKKLRKAKTTTHEKATTYPPAFQPQHPLKKSVSPALAP
jgi:hypothetical protein